MSKGDDVEGGRCRRGTMSKGEGADHPYCYPGTNVLRNKEDIRDNDELEAFERQHTADRMMTLSRSQPITVSGYREIHRYIFQDVYDWAGEYRTVDTGRTGPFCKARYIASHMDAQFAALKAENNLRGLSLHRFATRAAEHVSELNAIHCFLEGNGRTQRSFLEMLAKQAGYVIEPACIDSRAWNAAAAKSFHAQDYRPMQTVIAGAIVGAAMP
jgi:cell filamentation protein